MLVKANEFQGRMFQENENFYVIHPSFMGEVSEVNPHMRSILIDWLTQVQVKLSCAGIFYRIT